MSAIELDHVTRRFRSSVGTFRRHTKEIVALEALTLDIAQGELFGLLGPNGAGKTTTIKVLTTLLSPSSGYARVLGFDVVRDAQAVRKRIGFVLGGERGLYYRLSGRDNLRYFAELYEVAPPQIRTRVDEVLDVVHLRDRAEERVETYSRGMKQRLHLARTLLHRPEVLFLDEPTIGLDPVAARDLRHTLMSLHAEGVTIILTTHQLFEADLLCDRIGVINRGSLVALGTPAELKSHVRDLSVVEIEAFGIEPATLDRLRALDAVVSVTVESREQRDVLTLQTPVPERALTHILPVLTGVEIGRVVVREATLEDAYIRLVGTT